MCFFCLEWTSSIDVCKKDGNLLATGGFDKNIKIYDRRESRIVKTFEKFEFGMS